MSKKSKTAWSPTIAKVMKIDAERMHHLNAEIYRDFDRKFDPKR
jgi:hypothetical protein